jgi:hypothetical protein
LKKGINRLARRKVKSRKKTGESKKKTVGSISWLKCPIHTIEYNTALGCPICNQQKK